jgi:ribosome recycling factor
MSPYSSRQPLIDESACQVYRRAEDKIQTTLKWFCKECAALETYASGRVTSALLDSVKIQLPGSKDRLVWLDEVATVGVYTVAYIV